MAVRRCFCTVPFRRETCIKLSVFLLLGSVLGALCAKWMIQSEAVYLDVFSEASRDHASLVRSLLRSAILPAFMSVALVVRSRGMIALLFLAKGFLISYLLCAASICGAGAGRVLFTKLLMEAALTLPVLLYVGTVWTEDTRRGASHLFLLLTSIGAGFLAVFLENILF